MTTILARIFWLFVGHALCDFAFQSGYMAEGKNPANVGWFWCMFPHCLLHTGVVYFVTGSPFLALAEFVCHFVADYMKCRGRTTLEQDQFFHYACKVLWGILA